MEDQCGWQYCYQEEGVEELKQAILYTTLELETTIVAAKEEITRKEVEIVHLKDVLARTMKERDEVQSRYWNLLLEKLTLQQKLKERGQQLQQHPQVYQSSHQNYAPGPGSQSSRSEDEAIGSIDNKNSASSSSCEDCMIVPPDEDPSPRETPLPPQVVAPELVVRKPLPKKGKLLQAVMEAGPLLQTLLLAGPLPQWQHPPPQLDSTQIPPVSISTKPIHQIPCNNDKINGNFHLKMRSELIEGSESPYSKHVKIALS